MGLTTPEKTAPPPSAKRSIPPPPPPSAKRHIRCKICHGEDHNCRTCVHNILINSARPGKRRTSCKKISLENPKIQRLELFTKPIPDSGRQLGSQELLAEAKKIVAQELDRLQALVDADEISGFERAWFEASGETELWFDFAGMRNNVMNARFGVKDFDADAFGYNNCLRVVLNKSKPMNLDELVKTLLHETMHHNVTRGLECRPLNDNIDHLALALLGDPNECESFKLGWLSCVFSKCTSDSCRKYEWTN